MPLGCPDHRLQQCALATIAALTAWRLAWLPLSDMQLYVDEAQYWLWGQEMATGAWSKPPMVGWLIRLANEITGSSAPWVARAPWPLTHGAAALAVMALGQAAAGKRVGAVAGVVYATLPAVAAGSILVSTDSPLMLSLALFLLAWLRAPGRCGAALAGAALAAGMWSKYAMLFPLPGLVIAAWIDPRWRRSWADVAVVAGVAALLFAPNVVWNLHHDMATLRHTAENADWQRALHPARAARFMIEQFAVAGPLTFAALLAAFSRRWPAGLRGLIPLAALPLLIVTVQALLSQANANWAVGGYVAGAVLMAAWLAPRPRLAAAALVLNALVALALPILGTMAQDLRHNGRPLLSRYVGQDKVADLTLAQAMAWHAPLIVATDRALLATLTYGARTSGAPVAVRAIPGPAGPVPSHYDMIYPLRAETGPALWIGPPDTAPSCAAHTTQLPVGEGDLGRPAPATALLDDACLSALRR